MKPFFTILLISVVLSVAAAQAPLLSIGSETAIPDEYIVVLNEGLSVERRDSHVNELLSVHPGTVVMHRYNLGKIIGFAAVMSKGALARELEHEDVKYIEANQRVSVYDDTLTQNGATWGLDRISQVDLPLDTDYKYFKSAGEGVNAYVVDTGVLLTHQEFDGRAEFGANYIVGEQNDDCNGHGTHVAGTIGGVVFGVAKKVTIVSVKVLSCSGSGSYAGVISGIEFVVTHHQASKNKRSVANMSLGGGISAAVDTAVKEAVSAGVTFVVAAGNNNLNACNYSPSREPTAITVGATTITDNRASFSNYGSCLDIFAPGYNIESAWIGSNDATNTISGTSMAAPHVAGAVAALLGHVAETSSDVPTPQEVVDTLVKVASSGKVVGPGTNSPNKLLFSTYQ